MLTVYLDSPEEIAEALVKIAGRLREGAAKIEDEHYDEIVAHEDENYDLRQKLEAMEDQAAEIARLEARAAELEKTVEALDAQVDEAAERIVELEGALRDFAEHGTRHDLNPTIKVPNTNDPGAWSVPYVHYIKRIDEDVRARAKNALEVP